MTAFGSACVCLFALYSAERACAQSSWFSVTPSRTARDTTPPSVPANLKVSQVAASSLQLSWTASTDNVGVAGYRIYRNGTLIATTTSASYSSTGLSAGTAYSFRVSAYDASGNASAQSAALAVTTASAAGDTTPPSVPAQLTLGAVTSTTAQLTWAASTDNVGVIGYRVSRSGAYLTSSPVPSFSDTGLTAATAYSYTVAAYDGAGNVSAPSSPLAVTTSAATGTTRLVGPGQTYTRPCQALVAAQSGDTILIDAAGNGTYNGDVCAISANNLTIRGINGRAHIDAAGKSSQGKAIWVIAGQNTTVENIEFSGATVPDHNGAGIRAEGANLTVRNCSFHHNEDGLLSSPNTASDILIESSEFAFNGYGDGQTHNMYIGNVHSFTLRYCWTHDASVGGLIKSRAQTNYILYNRITGQNGTDSYEIDISNGGLTYVIGNIIQQPVTSQNSNVIAYGLEGVTNPSGQLYVVNNTFANDLGRGTFVLAPSSLTTPMLLQNNIFAGGGTLTSQPNAALTSNCVTNAPGFTNAAGFDYRLAAGSPCLNAGTAPGTGTGYALTPLYQYVHPTSGAPRVNSGAINAGAY